MTTLPDAVLLRRGLRLEYATLAWNVAGLDSLIEIVASLVVVWQLEGVQSDREHKAMRIIGVA